VYLLLCIAALACLPALLFRLSNKRHVRSVILCVVLALFAAAIVWVIVDNTRVLRDVNAERVGAK
jgi:hypothetical protein